MKIEDGILYNLYKDNKKLLQLFQYKKKYILRYPYGAFSVLNYELFIIIKTKIGILGIEEQENKIDSDGYQEGVYQLDQDSLENNIIVICFGDHAGIFVLDKVNAIIFMDDSKELFKHIYRNKLLWLP